MKHLPQKLFEWIISRLNASEIFPLHPPYPKSASSEVKKMIRRLIRVMSHIFYRHTDDLCHAANTAKPPQKGELS